MLQHVLGEAPFQVLATNFSISPSNEGYSLQISSDGFNYSTLFSVGAGVTRMVTGVSNGSYFRLLDNESEVIINWNKQCSDGGGGGGEYILPIASSDTLGGIKVGDGLSIDANGVLSSEGGAGDSHILMASSEAPQGIHDGDVYASLIPAHGTDYGTGWVDTESTGYTGTRDYTPGETLGAIMIKNAADVRLYWANEPWGTNDYFYISNGEFTSTPNGWTMVDSKHLEFTDAAWTGQAGYSPVLYADIVDGDLYFYSPDVTKAWVWQVEENSGGNVYTGGTITPAEDAKYAIYQAVSGSSALTFIEYAKASDLPAKSRLLPENPSDSDMPVFSSGQWRNSSRGSVIFDGLAAQTYTESDGDYQTLVRKSYWDFRWRQFDFTRNDAVSALPITTRDGNLYAYASGSTYGVYQAQGLSQNTTWIVPDDNSKGWAVARFPIDGQDCHIAFNMLGITEGGVVWNSDNSGEWSSGDYQFTSESGNFTYTGDGWSMTGSTDGSYAYLSFSEGVRRTYWISNAEVQIYLPNYVQIGSGSGGAGDYIHIDALTSGETGKTYEYEGRLMMWNADSGYTAQWYAPFADNQSTGLVYATIPDGQKIFSFKYTYDDDTKYRDVIYSGGTIYLFNTAATVVCAVTIGQTFQFLSERNNPSYCRIEGKYEKGWIGFRKEGTSTTLKDIWDGSVSGGHYELIDAANYPYPEATNGIPSWDNKGQIVGKARNVSTKDYYINTTGQASSHRTTVLTDGTNNGPNRFFAPVTGGDEGQILTSAGANAAPTWATMIKSLKITSDAYDALVQAGTTDPNTLYLIVDE